MRSGRSRSWLTWRNSAVAPASSKAWAVSWSQFTPAVRRINVLGFIWGIICAGASATKPLAAALTARVAFEDGVEQGVAPLPLLEQVVTNAPLVPHADLLHHACGRPVLRVARGVDAVELQLVESEGDQGRGGLGRV